MSQHIHVTEDVLNEPHKMKGRDSNIVNNNMFGFESCGLLQVADHSMIDEKLSNFLDKKLSSSSYLKLRKKMKYGEVRLISRHALNHEKVLFHTKASLLNG